MSPIPPPPRLFVGGHAWTVAGEAVDLPGDRCWTAACPLPPRPTDPASVGCLLDSGAFSDPPDRRRSPAAALDRQLAWEARARAAWDAPGWRAAALVSYDRLIDETWTEGRRTKRRWTVAAAESAVVETIAAAAYLAGHRGDLAPRTLVLSCQGVTVDQYAACAAEVLRHARPGDWLGLGGWCILGRNRSWLPEFAATLRAVLPTASAAGLGHVHLFGVLFLPALGWLAWEADRHGLSCSTDSATPIVAATRGDPRKAGMRGATWRDNVAFWRGAVTGLRGSPHYRPPPDPGRQSLLF